MGLKQNQFTSLLVYLFIYSLISAPDTFQSCNLAFLRLKEKRKSVSFTYLRKLDEEVLKPAKIHDAVRDCSTNCYCASSFDSLKMNGSGHCTLFLQKVLLLPLFDSG